jgi:hypothetical protein
MRFSWLVLLAMACSTDGTSDSCVTNSDCESNTCINGLCVILEDGGPGGDVPIGVDSGPDVDAGIEDAGDDDAGGDDAGDTGTPATMIEVAIEASSLAVRFDCDGGDEGDFFISVRLRDTTGAEPVLLGEDTENLVQAPGGALRSDLGIRASGFVPAVTGTTIVANVSFYENDPEGPQVTVGMGFTYIYDAAAPCWRLEGDDECLPEATGEIDTPLLQMRDGEACNADLRLRVLAAPPS